MWMIGVPNIAPAMQDQNFGDRRISLQGSRLTVAPPFWREPASAAAGGRNQSSHITTQASPKPPRTANPDRQPIMLPSQIMSTGAIKAPKLPPLIMSPLARDRSFWGKMEAVIRAAPGCAAASNPPSSMRAPNRDANPRARPARTWLSDQNSTNSG